MSTQKSVIEAIVERLGEGFTERAMFGEYALYCDAKVVALVCDNTMFVKVVDASRDLEQTCEKGPPYPGAKDHYIVTEDDLDRIRNLASLLRAVAVSLPEPPKKAPKKLTTKRKSTKKNATEKKSVGKTVTAAKARQTKQPRKPRPKKR